MTRARSLWLSASFATSFFVVGLPYWLIPYRQVNLPDALLTPGLLVVALCALFARLRTAASAWKATCVIGSSVIAVVAARIVGEAVADPTSHNLWPFEIVIACLVGFACAGAGALAGALIARLMPRAPGRDGA